MAKKSLASLSVVPISKKDSRLPAPASFSVRARQIWAQVVGAKPADWFTVDCQGLLAAYILAIESHEIISEQIADSRKTFIEPRDMKILYDMQAQQGNLIAAYATKMRLTAQARWQPSTAAAKSAKAGTARPWD